MPLSEHAPVLGCRVAVELSCRLLFETRRCVRADGAKGARAEPSPCFGSRAGSSRRCDGVFASAGCAVDSGGDKSPAATQAEKPTAEEEEKSERPKPRSAAAAAAGARSAAGRSGASATATGTATICSAAAHAARGRRSATSAVRRSTASAFRGSAGRPLAPVLRPRALRPAVCSRSDLVAVRLGPSTLRPTYGDEILHLPELPRSSRTARSHVIRVRSADRAFVEHARRLTHPRPAAERR